MDQTLATEKTFPEPQIESILRGAAALFRRNGYDATSLREIGEAVGLSKAGVYHYFSSKEDILEAVAARAITVLFAQLEEALSVDSSPIQVLRELVRGRVRTIAEEQDIMAVFWQELPTLSDELQADLRSRLREYRGAVRTVVENGIRSGDLREDVDPHLVTLGLDGITGWCYLWFRPTGRLSAEDVGEAFWTFLWQGLQPPD
jgi:AcrR family transcriptional regulator